MADPKPFKNIVLISVVFFIHNLHFSDGRIELHLREIRRAFDRSDVLVQFFGENSPAIHEIESRTFSSDVEKVEALIDNLKSLAERTQGPITNLLRLFNVESESFWSSNQMVIRNAPLTVLELVDTFPQVMLIRTLPVIHLLPPIAESEVDESTTNDMTEWGVLKVKADEVSNITKGKGVLVASIDTGVRGSHKTLKDNWLHEGWFDPLHKTTDPTDEDGHGTHVTGTMVGTGGIGVAPEANWIAARGCDETGCDGDMLIKCGQWMVQDPRKRLPDIINNSWGGPLPGDDFLDATIRMWNAAGILSVFANGNVGLCETTGSPAYSMLVISVGATNINDELAEFSSRGPVLTTRAQKPDVGISAPGENIRSAWHTSDNAYNTISGTSMAAPHVSGVLALMLSAIRIYVDPTFRFTFDVIQNSLHAMVDTDNLTAPLIRCPLTSFANEYKLPNCDYGQGLINAVKVIAIGIGMGIPTPTPELQF